jgi:hypothetical protein
MKLRKIIIILINLLAKSCGMKHHLKFDLEKCYTSSSVAQPDAWSANPDILSLQREHLSFPSLLSLILESELKVDLEEGASSPGLLIVLCDNSAFA